MSDISSDDPDRIESRLEETCARMDSRLNALEDRLSPSQLMDDAMRYFREGQAAGFLKDLSSTLLSNPVPTLMAGAGLAWLAASAFRGPSTERGTESTGDRLQSQVEAAARAVMRRDDESDAEFHERVQAARGKALGLVRDAQESSDGFGARISGALRSGRDKLSNIAGAATAAAGEMAAQAGDVLGVNNGASAPGQAGGGQAGVGQSGGGQSGGGQSGGMMSSLTGNAILLGAVGLGVGAVLGAVLPRFEFEEKALGDVADAARDTVKQTARDIVDRGGAAVQETLDAGLASARSHGLDTELTLGETARAATSGELLQNVTEVARETIEAGKNALQGATGAETDQGGESGRPSNREQAA